MISWMCERRTATRRGVKACAARPRMRVWAGASMKSICRTITWATGPSSGSPMASSCTGVGVRSATNRWSTWITSA